MTVAVVAEGEVTRVAEPDRASSMALWEGSRRLLRRMSRYRLFI